MSQAHETAPMDETEKSVVKFRRTAKWVIGSILGTIAVVWLLTLITSAINTNDERHRQKEAAAQARQIAIVSAPQRPFVQQNAYPGWPYELTPLPEGTDPKTAIGVRVEGHTTLDWREKGQVDVYCKDKTTGEVRAYSDDACGNANEAIFIKKPGGVDTVHYSLDPA